MSEDGRQAFLDAQGLDDWAVLHGGAAAVFAVRSLHHGAQVAQAIAALPELDDPQVRLTLAGDTLTVRLTRDMWLLEARHVAMAREVSEVARALDAPAVRDRIQEVQVAVSARPADADIDFWRAVLGYDAASPDNGVDPLGHGSTVWMQELDPDRPLRHAMHVDVSVPRDQATARVAAAVAAGGRVVAEHEAPGAWILADRAGNKVCIAAWPDGAALGEPGEVSDS